MGAALGLNAAPAGTSGGAQVLPRLRPELSLEFAPAQPGQPAGWRLLDPMRQRVFLVSEHDRELLALWDAGTLQALQLRAVAQGFQWDPEQAQALVDFLKLHQLVQPPTGQLTPLQTQARAAHPRGMKGWLARYLGWRLPLVQPQGFLVATLPLVRCLWSAPLLALWALCTLLGLYLVGRQWDGFVNTFTSYLTPQGLVSVALALAGLKVIHELGHAYATVAHGGRVSSMGISLVMLAPMLYTDTSDAARLDSRRARLWIDAGGVLAESYVAGLATLAWAVMPDGPLRGVCFLIASTSWLTTLVVNLNPLSRFDGYYFLSDALRLPNLQDRSLAYAGWALGRLMLGAVEPPPEAVTPTRAVGFTLYGSAVWLYRIALSLTAAWLTYTWLFKLAGIAMALVEAWIFVFKPLQRRLALWWRLRSEVTGVRWLLLMLLGMGAASLLTMPLDRQVAVPAVLAWKQVTVLQAPEVALIEEVLVTPGQAVVAGQPLLRLSSPELTRRRAAAKATQVLTLERLDRISGDMQDRAQAQVLRQQRREAEAELAGLSQRETLLLIKASADGWVADLPAHLQPGLWVRPDQVLGRVLHGQSIDAQGYIADIDLARLNPGASARFVADDLRLPALPLRLESMELHSAEQVTPDVLSSLHGGPVPSVADRQGRAQPVGAWHRAAFSVDTAALGPQALRSQVRGQVQVEASPDSLLRQCGRRLWRLLIAEAQS